jgi:radical SAM protein with 4Fe4S-binding SPASM domain
MLRHDNLFRGRVTRADATDMTPLHRYSCRQWRAGLYVLADGSVVPCREDVDGEQALGRVEDGLRAIWTGEKSARFHNLHERGQWDEDSFCASCKEWYYNFE